MRLLPLILLLSVVATLAPQSAAAQSNSHGGGDFGLGLIVGNPTGLSGKYFMSREMAIDGALGLGLLGAGHLRLHSDFLWHFGVQRWAAAGLDLYVGVGPTLAIWDRGGRNRDGFGLGARAPFGASMSFVKAPFDVFLELAMELWIVEHVNLDLDAALGIRFWF